MTEETTDIDVSNAEVEQVSQDGTPDEDRVSDATSSRISNAEVDDDLDTTEGAEEDSTPSDGDDVDDINATPESEPDSFPREYVEKLRDENAKYRQRAQRADDLAHRLHQTLVDSTGRLMDPSDLEFDEKHLDDPEALRTAIDGLLEEKPYLAKRTPKGSVGQGESGASGTVDLAGILRSRA